MRTYVSQEIIIYANNWEQNTFWHSPFLSSSASAISCPRFSSSSLFLDPLLDALVNHIRESHLHSAFEELQNNAEQYVKIIIL